MCQSDEEPVDTLVFLGDAAALVAYGSVQGIVDIVLGPLAAAEPNLFDNDLPIDNPVAQGSLIALLWVLLARYSGGYSFSRTRVLPDALLACAATWLGTCAILLGALALLGAAGIGPGASPAETDFIIGTGTVVGGWRLVCASALPKP